MAGAFGGLKGAVQLTAAVVSPAVADTPVGASGVQSGSTVVTVEGALVPTPLVAVTANWRVSPGEATTAPVLVPSAVLA